jgi:uncharacterized protein YbaP (TraB family)
MAGLLVAAAFAAAMPAAAPAAAAPTNPEPAIFVVRDADTTVYIFGTFHALAGKSEWFKSGVRNAFESSDELVLETLIPEQPTTATAAVTQPRPSPLRGFAVAPSASFLASTRMAISAGRSQGMQVDNGADMVLRRAAEAEGKPVEGLETLDSQLSMFNRLPPSAAPAQPQDARAAPAMNSLSKSMSEMQSAWKRGDQAVFVRVLGQLEQASPDTYRMMFTERNARWADWIRARMQTPGTVFVAVGAGHLAGKDSVLVKLAQLGIPSARVY